MTKELTSEELRKRKTNTEKFDQHWEIDCKTLEIKHIALNFCQKFSGLFWRRKFKVSQLYWWQSYKWYTAGMMPFTDPVKHDDIIIKGFPRKYQMTGGWTIPKDDLKYLYDGPLVSKDSIILVKHQTKVQTFISLFNQLRPLSWILSLLLFCIRCKDQIVILWNYIF